MSSIEPRAIGFEPWTLELRVCSLAPRPSWKIQMKPHIWLQPIVLRRHDVEVEEPSQAASFCRSNGVMSSIEPVESRRAVGGAHCDLSPSACLPFWQTNKKHILLLWITLYLLHILQSTLVSTSTSLLFFIRIRHHFEFLFKNYEA